MFRRGRALFGGIYKGNHQKMGWVFVMIDKINDIRKALLNKTYISAVALALTLPDICSQVENNTAESS